MTAGTDAGPSSAAEPGARPPWRTVTEFPRAVREIENLWIPLPDGCRLAARIWLPEDADARPVPAILEYLPYRKRDGTTTRDALSLPYLAGHGYAAVRVDLRGSGDSDGLLDGEYLPAEQDDAVAVIAWLAVQSWCSGRVGMWGISWGGFNALQVAARRPPALGAIVTLCSTDDRYADDIHYKGGCLLLENLGWASTMFAYQSRPPDPALVGERWREMWAARLEHLPLLVATWLEHPRRDAFWKHGSVCEDFAAITAPTLAVGGWGDAYHNAVPRLLAGLAAPARGITGPWAHKYPHFAVPAPRIGFLQESLRWWDHWLKDAATGVMGEPLYRAYLMDAVRPAASYAERGGRWISADAWPDPQAPTRTLYLAPGRLEDTPAGGAVVSVRSPLDTGTAGGEYCAIWLGPESPVDQRGDDAGSLVFDTDPLAEPLALFGAARFDCRLSADAPTGQIAVRLCDVWPDGAATRVTYGTMNLCHRDSHENPAPLVPGEPFTVALLLDDVAYEIPAGHRLRLAVSSAYWPLLWPGPDHTTLTLSLGDAQLALPLASAGAGDRAVTFPPPEAAAPVAARNLRPSRSQRTVTRDVGTGLTHVRIRDDFGARRLLDHGLEVAEVCREHYRIDPEDPGSCVAEVRWTEHLGRGDWSTRTETRTRMWADASHFHLRASLDAFAGEEHVCRRRWRRKVPRDLV